jgi:hypothetical protein
MWFCERCATSSPSKRAGCTRDGCGGALRAMLDRDELTALVERLLALPAGDPDLTRTTRVFVVNAQAHGMSAPRPMIERALEDRWPLARVLKAVFAGERTAARTPKKRSAAAKKAVEKAREKGKPPRR